MINKLLQEFFDQIRKPYISISLIYFAISVVWILATDSIAEINTPDAHTLILVQNIKGILFVLVSSVIIFLLVKNNYDKVQKSKRTINDSLNYHISILEKLDVPIWKMDLRGKLLYSNNALKKFFLEKGIDFNKEQDFHKRFNTKSIYEYKSLLNNSIENKTGYKFLYSLIDKTGNKCWIEERSNPFFDRHNKLSGFMGIIYDRTEQIIQSEALQLESEKLRAVIEASPLAIIDIDTDGLVSSIWNKSAENIFGWTKEEVIGKKLPFIPNEFIDQFNTLVNIAIKENSLTGLEVKRNKKGDIPIDIRLAASALKNNKSEIIGVMAILEDITEEKRIADSLRESENMLKFLVESIHDIVFTLDSDLKHSGLYGNWKKNYDINLEEYIGKTAIEYFGEENGRIHHEANKKAINGETVKYISTTEVNSETVYYQTTVSPISDNDGNYIGVVGIGRDITDIIKAKKEVEEHKEVLKKIFDNIPVLIGLFDSNGKFELVNKEWESVLGYTIDELKKIDNILEAFYPNPTEREEVLNYMQSAPAKKWKDFQPINKSGEPVDTTWSNVKLSDGRSIGIGQDISERKKREREILEYQQKLSALTAHIHSLQEEERRLIAREIHDELGQILTSIKMNLNMVKHNITNNEGVIDKTVILDEINTLLRNIDLSIKSVKKIISELRPEFIYNLSLNEALKYLISTYEKEADLNLKLNYKSFYVDCSNEIKNIIYRSTQECLTNIIKHSQARNAAVTIFNDDQNILLNIHDDGIGIKDSDLSKKDSFGIIGLKERINSVKGSIVFENPNGIGTEVKINIPFAGKMEGH